MVKTIPKWGCLGYWGYGHGRSVKEHGDKWFKDVSVCQDLCPNKDQCRRKHHVRMDNRYPEVAEIVHATAGHASKMKVAVVQSVIGAMNVAKSQGVAGTDEIRRVLDGFGVSDMTDHYVCGQFENIQNGLDGKDPELQRPIPSAVEELQVQSDDSRKRTQ